MNSSERLLDSESELGLNFGGLGAAEPRLIVKRATSLASGYVCFPKIVDLRFVALMSLGVLRGQFLVICTCTYVYTYTYIYTHIHIYIYMYSTPPAKRTLPFRILHC